PVLNPLVWMLRYEYPVHTFRDEAPPPSLPAQPTYLVACRDPAYRVVYLELNMVSARLLELVDQHPAASGRELLALIANELAQACDDAFLASGRDTLERMRAKAVLLGTRTPP